MTFRKKTRYLRIIGLIWLGACATAEDRQVEQVISELDIGIRLEAFDSLHAGRMDRVDADILFWKTKLGQQADGFTYAERIASLYETRFALTGRREDVDSSRLYLKEALTHRNGWKDLPTRCTSIKSLLTLHRFREAEIQCRELQEQHRNSLPLGLLRFDALMEIGTYQEAGRVIRNLEKTASGYDLLVRRAKYFDHIGNLPAAIEDMKSAYALSLNAGNPAVHAWTCTLLGEFLSHFGDIESARDLYLEALDADPLFEAAWQRIAWIAHVEDGNGELQRRILEKINTRSTPGLLWELAGAYESMDSTRSSSYLKDFYQMATDPKNELWYAPKIALVEAEVNRNYEKALTISRQEVEDRPTLASYDLLAWCYYLSGDLSSAKEVVQSQLEGKTGEPLILYHMGEIYRALGEDRPAMHYFIEALEATFELGPKIENDIRTKLDRLKMS